MNNYNQNFKQFRIAFKNNEPFAAMEYLSKCFMSKPKNTLLELYKKGFLFKEDFLQTDVSTIELPDVYRVLIATIKTAVEQLNLKTVFIKHYSKKQLLQGVANYLEKNNVEFKYNAKWTEKNNNGNVEYLEAERQSIYISDAGILFQELLKQFYGTASDTETFEIVWDIELAEKFTDLLRVFGIYSELKDVVERHLYFDWQLELVDAKTIKTSAPIGQKEGSFSTDLINFRKLKIAVEGLDGVAHENLIKNYLMTIKEGTTKTAEFWKHGPDKNNEEQLSWFAEAKLIDIKADLIVERELALYSDRYFPGIENLEGLKLSDDTTLPLRDTFRVLAFISELSKTYIKTIDAEYTNGVNIFYYIYGNSTDAKEIKRKTETHKGDSEGLNDILKLHYTETFVEEKQKIIAEAKKHIGNDNCLIKFNYDKLIKTIQWLHQYDLGFIEKVLAIFTYNSNEEEDVTRVPFFKLKEELCWMPNMVAHVSFAENLIENLLRKKLISIHRMQTDYYEKSLKNIFKKAGYQIIEDDKDKIIRENNREIGDFDLLSYKDGHLINLQLKLTHAHNDYYSRYKWKDTALTRAAEQLETGLKFINENPEHIRKILGLKATEPIEKISSFIIGNSHLYDHETIRGFLKVSYFEVVSVLRLIEYLNKNASGKADKLAEMLNKNLLFKYLEKEISSIEHIALRIGEYSLLRPGVIQKTLYTAF